MACDSFTVLMLHCNGADASTSFPDASISNHSMTANSGASVTTAQSEFGGASGLFDGVASYVDTGDSTDWTFGSGDFTFDFWTRFNTFGVNNYSFLSQYNNINSNRSFLIDVTVGNKIRFIYTTDGTNVTQTNLQAAWTPSTATWYHVAIVRTGTGLLHFVNGTTMATIQSIPDTIFDSTLNLAIGAYKGADANPSDVLDGWMDEIRISKGIARWTTNFTPPTQEYCLAVTNIPKMTLLGIG